MSTHRHYVKDKDVSAHKICFHWKMYSSKHVLCHCNSTNNFLFMSRLHLFLGLRKSSIISNKQKCVLDMNKIITRPPCLTYVTAPVYGRFRLIAFQGKMSTVVYWVHWESSIYLSITWADDIFLQKPSSQYEIYSQRQSSLRHCKQTVYAICLD